MGEILRKHSKTSEGEAKMEKDEVAVNEQLEKYKCFLEQMRYDGGLLWRIFGALLLPQAIFLAFLLSAAFGDKKLTGWSPGAFIAAIAGLSLCVIWLLSYFRAIALYDYSYDRAKKIEPQSWDLLNGPREKFIKGNLPWMKWYHRLRVRQVIPFVIVTFLVIYSFIFILCGPWMK